MWLFYSSIGCKTWLGRRRRDDPMINTLSKTLEAQEKTQDIKQSPSMKIGTKPDARSWRYELTEMTGRWTRRWKVIDQMLRSVTRLQQASAAATGRWTSKMTRCTDDTIHHPSNTLSIDRTLVVNRLDAEQQRSIEYREVPERQNCDRTRLVACDRMPAVSDQLIAALTVGTTEHIRSGRQQRPVSSRKAGFCPQRLLS